MEREIYIYIYIYIYVYMYIYVRLEGVISKLVSGLKWKFDVSLFLITTVIYCQISNDRQCIKTGRDD